MLPPSSQPWLSLAVRWQQRSISAAALLSASRNRTSFVPSRVKGAGASVSRSAGMTGYQKRRRTFCWVTSIVSPGVLAVPEACHSMGRLRQHRCEFNPAHDLGRPPDRRAGGGKCLHLSRIQQAERVVLPLEGELRLVDGFHAAILQDEGVGIGHGATRRLQPGNDLVESLLAREAHELQAEGRDMAVDARELQMHGGFVAERGDGAGDLVEIVGSVELVVQIGCF